MKEKSYVDGIRIAIYPPSTVTPLWMVVTRTNLTNRTYPKWSTSITRASLLRCQRAQLALLERGA